MSRFYAEIQGNRGYASRMGSVESGMWGHVRGWGLGCRVSCATEGEKDQADRVNVQLSGGSNGSRAGVDMFTARETTVPDIVELTVHFPKRAVYYLNRDGRRVRKPRSLNLEG